MSLYFKKIKVLAVFIALTIGIQSCNQFLDIVPDNVATIENAFTLRNEAEKYLFTCYSYIPQNGNVSFNIGMLAGDEVWKNNIILPNTPSYQIAIGTQTPGNVQQHVW